MSPNYTPRDSLIYNDIKLQIQLQNYKLDGNTFSEKNQSPRSEYLKDNNSFSNFKQYSTPDSITTIAARKNKRVLTEKEMLDSIMIKRK
jgi:hypothetical protein